jgi:hypothetical protein
VQFYLISESTMLWLKAVILDAKHLAEKYGAVFLESHTNAYGAVLDKAAKIDLPEMHTFVDADNFKFDICGWDKDSAAKALEDDNRAKPPFTWSGSYIAYPGFGAIKQGVEITEDDREKHLNALSVIEDFLNELELVDRCAQKELQKAKNALKILTGEDKMAPLTEPF